jgi:transcriptional regulator with XRE-family HTH domain
MFHNIEKKEQAIKLRKAGKSYPEIERKLGVPRSTLSGWLSGVKLTKPQTDRLFDNKLKALVEARLIAAKVHKENRLKKIKEADDETSDFISKVKIDKTIGEIIFSTFYQAEGTKNGSAVVIANSNRDILKAMLNLFRYLFNPKESKFSCCLHLRRDQSDDDLKDFWSKALKIPVNQFTKTQFDKRTLKTTYDSYKGVCVISYSDVHLFRRVLFVGNKLVKILANHQQFKGS